MFAKTLFLTSAAFLCFNENETMAKTTYTQQECANFETLNFDLFNYADYDEYFDEDSKLTLAQSGVYQGPKGIEEFINFFDVTSPYVDGKMLYSKTSPELSYFDPVTGICQFTTISTQGLVMNNALTQGGEINYGAITKVYYSIPDNNVQNVNLYYTNDFLSNLFGRLDTYEVREFVCELLTGPSCEYANSFNGKMKIMKCMKKLDKLSLSEGTGHYMDGNSLGCRAFYSVAAETNPARNCAYLSLVPIEDPKGNTGKCQISESISPFDLFSQEERYHLMHHCEKEPKVGAKTCVKVFEARDTPNSEDTCHDKERRQKGSLQTCS